MWVLLAKDFENPKGFPPEWPAEFSESKDKPGDAWQPCTNAELVERKAKYRGEYDIWKAKMSDLRRLQEYDMHRSENYPPVGQQLDALWHAMDKGILSQVPGFYDEIKRVKEEFPKP